MSTRNGQVGSYNRSRTGCTNCRLRHLKCDDIRPSCTRCLKRGAKCVRGFNIRFKHYSSVASTATKSSNPKLSQYNFPSDQTWCVSQNGLSFVDENRDLHSCYESRSDSDVEEDVDSSPSGEQVAEMSTVIVPTSNSHISDQQNVLDSVNVESYSHSDVFNWPLSDLDNQIEASPGGGSSVSIGDLNRQSRLYNDVPMWPIGNATEARLIRYFIDYVSRRFDLCDPDKHFALVVPCRAAVCPPLMDAVFALSARYLSRTTDFDEYIADQYYQRCLNSLVPILSDSEALLNQDLFAAIVVLRTLEEVEVPLSGADSGTHLFGSHLFVNATTEKGASPGMNEPQLEMRGLRRAAFLVAFRQEVYTAFVSQRPVIKAFYLYDVDRSVEAPADDCTWTNRILLHVADTLEFCFGDNSAATDVSSPRYEDLVAYGSDWYAKKPQSFSHIFYGNIDGNNKSNKPRISPDIWLLSDVVVTGLLNYHLSRILLLAFDPRTPRLGSSRANYLKRQNKEIKEEVGILIGMANGNPGCPPHFVLACVGITLAGDRFEERWEQEELLKFLKKTQDMYAWSTSTAQHHLMEAWGLGNGDLDDNRI